MRDGAAPTATARRPGQALGLAALAALLAALTITPISNNDIFLHLRTGAIVLDTGSVPRVDDYSALAAGRPFVAHEWLAGVIFRLVERAGGERGFDALVLLKAAVALLTALVLARTAARLGAAPWVAIPCIALVMILAAARFLERPHIFSYLLLAAFIALLARRRQRLMEGRPHRRLLLLAGLQVLWANLHGSFLLGPLVVGLAAVAAAAEALAAADRRRHLVEAGRLALAAGVLVAASLVNPYGAALLRFPFDLTGSAFMGQIYEWLPPYAEPFRSTYMARYYVVWAAIGIAAHAAVLLRRRRSGGPEFGLFPAFLFAAFLLLSLRMNRNVTDFAIATCPGVAAALATLAPRREPGRRARAAIVAVLLGLAGWFALFGYPFSPSSRRPFGLGLAHSIPVAAADYVGRNGLVGNAFNTYSAGAYLVYRFHPAVRVAMDSRNDVYGEELWAGYTRALASPPELARLLDRIDASFIFLEWPQPGLVATAVTVRALAPAWRPVYFDDAAVVYLEEGGRHAALLERDGYRVLDPALFRPGQWSGAEAAAALAETRRAIAAGGAPCIARVMRIEALLTLGRTEEARVEEARLVAEDPPLYHVHILLGLAHLARGERDAAAARLRRALDLNPASEAARQGLERALAPG